MNLFKKILHLIDFIDFIDFIDLISQMNITSEFGEIAKFYPCENYHTLGTTVISQVV